MSVFDLTKLEQAALESKQKPLLLLVDDEIENLKVLTLLLEDDFEPITAANPAQARSKIEKLSKNQPLQLVIGDSQLFENIGQRLPDTPFILMSGDSTITNQTGLFALQTKPIDPQTFLSTVHQGIEAYQQRQKMLALCNELAMEIQVISEQLAGKKLALEQARETLSATKFM